MKKIIILFLALVVSSAILTWSCEDQDAVNESTNGLAVDELGNSKGTTNSTQEASPFRADAGGSIPEATAKAWKENYRKIAFNGVESHFFGAETLRRLLNQPGAAGVSIHYALSDSNVPQLLLVAVDRNGNHLGKTTNLAVGTTDVEEEWQDRSLLCPPHCAN